jgi:7-carboxy-7-deazaguanine synthase
MTYTVREMFLTQQGEGLNIGRTAVFIRFAGCNLWSGREADRAEAVCRFCDTDFVGGKRMSAAEVSDAAAALWPAAGPKFCVLTGGEPLLQVDRALIDELWCRCFEIAVETNGTQELPGGCINWVCVSPKAGARLALNAADEIKLVYPQAGTSPADFDGFNARHFWLSPMDGPNLSANTEAAIGYCSAHPRWRLAIQAHKAWGVR